MIFCYLLYIKRFLEIMEEKIEIKHYIDLIDEHNRCRLSIPYFCKQYVHIENKIEFLCKECPHYDYCHYTETDYERYFD